MSENYKTPDLSGIDWALEQNGMQVAWFVDKDDAKILKRKLKKKFPQITFTIVYVGL